MCSTLPIPLPTLSKAPSRKPKRADFGEAQAHHSELVKDPPEGRFLHAHARHVPLDLRSPMGTVLEIDTRREQPLHRLRACT